MIFVGFSFIEITISVCCLFLLFVFVLHSQNGGIFFYQSVFGSASASTSIGASAVLWLGSCAFETAVEEPLSGGDVWWCVFWKVGCRISRMLFEHEYVYEYMYSVWTYVNMHVWLTIWVRKSPMNYHVCWIFWGPIFGNFARKSTTRMDSSKTILKLKGNSGSFLLKRNVSSIKNQNWSFLGHPQFPEPPWPPLPPSPP